MEWKQLDSIKFSTNTSYKKTERLKQDEKFNLMYHDRTKSICFIIDARLHIHHYYYPNLSLPLMTQYQLEVIKQFQDTLLTGDLFITMYDQVILNHQPRPSFPNKNHSLLCRLNDPCQR